LVEFSNTPIQAPPTSEDPTIFSQGVDSQTTRTVVAVTRTIAISSVFSAGSFSTCGTFGFSFIKMFQIIEILSKLIYLPVRFSGKILSILKGVS